MKWIDALLKRLGLCRIPKWAPLPLSGIDDPRVDYLMSAAAHAEFTLYELATKKPHNIYTKWDCERVLLSVDMLREAISGILPIRSFRIPPQVNTAYERNDIEARAKEVMDDQQSTADQPDPRP